MNRLHFITATLIGLLAFTQIGLAEPTSERVAELKANLQASKAILRHYQWIETTVVSVNGDEKSSKQQLCSYADDGSIQRTELDQTQSGGGGFLFHRLRERKKEEMTEYMKSAVALIKTYVPPSPSMIQACKDAGNFSLTILDPGKRARITFTNYEQQGDSYSIDISLVSNRPLRLHVSTYLNDPSQPVTLTVNMREMDNGASYPSQSILNADAKGLIVTITNSDYQRN